MTTVPKITPEEYRKIKSKLLSNIRNKEAIYYRYGGSIYKGDILKVNFSPKYKSGDGEPQITSIEVCHHLGSTRIKDIYYDLFIDGFTLADWNRSSTWGTANAYDYVDFSKTYEYYRKPEAQPEPEAQDFTKAELDQVYKTAYNTELGAREGTGYVIKDENSGQRYETDGNFFLCGWNELRFTANTTNNRKLKSKLERMGYKVGPAYGGGFRVSLGGGYDNGRYEIQEKAVNAVSGFLNSKGYKTWVWSQLD